MQDLTELSAFAKRNMRKKWYAEFCAIYDASGKTANWLKRDSGVFNEIKQYLRYTEGKSGFCANAQELFHIRNPKYVPACICGVQLRWHSDGYANYCRACGNKACVEKRVATNLKRYGVKNPSQNEEIKARRVETFIKHFGVDNPWKSKQVKQKIKETLLRKYGVEYPSQSEEFKERARNTSYEKYGATHWTKVFESSFDFNNPMHRPECVKRIKETNLRKYGHEYAAQNANVARSLQISMRRVWDNPKKRKELLHKCRATKLRNHGDPFYTGNSFKRYTVQDARGRVHKVQGYERFVIPDLDARGVQSIKSSSLPLIKYGYDQTYKPDLLTTLKSGERRLIEVKSRYILADNLSNNLKKFVAASKACKKRGLTFWLAIVENKRHEVKWIKDPVQYVKQLLAQE